MATLAPVIRFRSLANELTDKEYEQFLCKATQQFGRDFILKPLFYHFSGMTFNDATNQILDGAIAIISGIIKDREKASDGNPCTRNDIASLSSALIGEIGSYLNQDDHIAFSTCCRITYIGCNTPCTLRVLNLIGVSDYSSVPSLRYYPQIRELYFKLKKFKELSFPPNSHIFSHHLYSLNIDNEGEADADISGLLQCSTINFDNITHLELIDFSTARNADDGDYFSMDTFLELLLIFPRLWHLYLSSAYFPRFQPEELSKFISALPNLQVFVQNGSSDSTTIQMVASLAPQLQALRCKTNDLHTMPDIIKNKTFPALKELEVRAVIGAESIFEQIVESAPMLNRVGLGFEEDASSAEPFIRCVFPLKTRITELFIDSYISKINDVCSGIERGLFEIEQAEHNRKSIQIKILIDCDVKCAAKDIIFQITRIVNRLYLSKIEQYLFLLSFYEYDDYLPDESEWEETIKSFIESNNERFDIFLDGMNMIVSNKDCTLGGCIQRYLTDDWMSHILVDL